MSMTTCRECGKDISTEAKACPHCGVPKPAAKGFGFSGLIWVGLILGFLYLIAAPGSRHRAPPKQDDLSLSAKGACMEFIKRTLDDPYSAQFDISDNAAYSQSGDTFTVTRSVRAKNAFNAYRQSVFQCVMKHDSGTWRAISIKQL